MLDYLSSYRESKGCVGFDVSLPSLAPLEEIKAQAVKTGTTIAGCVCADGVVLAADTRATMGMIVASKHCLKLHSLATNIYAAGAGTAADLQHVTDTLQAELKLFAWQTGQDLIRVETCLARLSQHLFKYQGHVSVALIIGGVDALGRASLCYQAPNGGNWSLPFLAMGSGGLFALSMLESGYKDNMKSTDAINLVADAIESGVMNDCGSGTAVDVVFIPKSNPREPQLIRSYRSPVKHMIRPVNQSNFRFPLGTTKILKEEKRPVAKDHNSHEQS